MRPRAVALPGRSSGFWSAGAYPTHASAICSTCGSRGSFPPPGLPLRRRLRGGVPRRCHSSNATAGGGKEYRVAQGLVTFWQVGSRRCARRSQMSTVMSMAETMHKQGAGWDPVSSPSECVQKGVPKATPAMPTRVATKTRLPTTMPTMAPTDRRLPPPPPSPGAGALQVPWPMSALLTVPAAREEAAERCCRGAVA